MTKPFTSTQEGFLLSIKQSLPETTYIENMRCDAPQKEKTSAADVIIKYIRTIFSSQKPNNNTKSSSTFINPLEKAIFKSKPNSRPVKDLLMLDSL